MYQSMMLKNNQKVNYVTQGEGKPVVMVHGLAASLHDWDDLFPELSANGYAGYALDLTGHGESEKPLDHTHYTFQNLYHDFSAWLDSLGLPEPFPLIGHSLGGGLSLQYALMNPQKVSGLVLVNPFYDIHQLPRAIRLFFHTPLLKTRFIERTPYRLFRFFIDMTSYNFYIGHRERHVLPEHIRYQTALDYTRASSGIYHIPRTLSSTAFTLSQLQQPTLILYGARDQTLNPKSFSQLASMLPNVKGTHAFPICGHVPHQCHPEQFNPHVMGFLKTL